MWFFFFFLIKFFFSYYEKELGAVATDKLSI